MVKAEDLVFLKVSEYFKNSSLNYHPDIPIQKMYIEKRKLCSTENEN